MFLEPHVPGISNDDFLYTAPRFGLGRNQNVTYIQQVSIPPDAWAEDHLDDTITLRVNFNTTTATDMWAEKRIMAVPIAQYSSANTSGWLMNDAINGFTAFPTEQVAPRCWDGSCPCYQLASWEGAMLPTVEWRAPCRMWRSMCVCELNLRALCQKARFLNVPERTRTSSLAQCTVCLLYAQHRVRSPLSVTVTVSHSHFTQVSRRHGRVNPMC